MALARWLIICFVVPGTLAAQDLEEQPSFYVSSIGWHSSIVISAAAFPESLWPPVNDFSDALFLEIGWGEADYYPSESFNLWYALKSIFWPTASVLHIKPITMEVDEYYYNTNVVKLKVKEDQFQMLLEYLVNSFQTDANGKIIPATEGLSPESYFFKGNEKYYFPKNSNVWAARALKSSGYSLIPIWYQTTDCLLNKADNFGEKVVSKK